MQREDIMGRIRKAYYKNIMLSILGISILISSKTWADSIAKAPPALKTEISYTQGNMNKSQSLDIYRPVTQNKNLPVHIYVHGGAWIIGDKSSVKYRDAVTYLDNNIIVVSINYRLAGEAPHPAQVQDISAAVQWIYNNIAQYGGDPENMVLSGHSAGAHLVALLATHPDYLQQKGLPNHVFKAVFCIDTAAYDLTANNLGRQLNRARRKTFGTDRSIWVDASPLTHASNDIEKSKFYIYASQRRKEAGSNSNQFSARLKDSGYEAILSLKEDRSHSQMQDAIFEKGSLISDQIIAVLDSNQKISK